MLLLDARRVVLRVLSPLLIVGGCMTIIMSVMTFVVDASLSYGTLSGVVLVLLGFILSAYEFATIRPIFRTERGSWKSNLYAVAFPMLFRLLLIYTTFAVIGAGSRNKNLDGQLNIVNIIALGIEAAVLAAVYLNQKAFMPTDEEVQVALKRFRAGTVRTVSECPTCHEIVEKDWLLCPQCGTRLPRYCPNCGSLLTTRAEKCANCGTEIEKPEEIRKSIVALRAIADEEARPEARSVRYARLAEAYLKAGDIAMAVETYKKAIHFTEFDRKRANFMVKMAMILHNDGRDKEAFDVLDAAISIDPADPAGAMRGKNQIMAHGKIVLANEAIAAARLSEASDYLRQALEIDPDDYYGAKGIMASVEPKLLKAKAEEALTAGRKDEAISLLQKAVEMDPEDHSGSMALLKNQGGEPKSQAKEKRKKK